ncbi:hypothetical protein ACL9RL_03745 [Plantibacter sp. Mn2098]|uniref:hypothetical protein n=1 Tax=Plantibacter sp. Mn2098 TaxID=3395266 RepID=UPI003BEDB285
MRRVEHSSTIERLEPEAPLERPASARMATAHTIVAALFLLILGMRIQVWQGFTVGFGLAILLLPLWAAQVRRYRGAGWLIALTFGAAASGIWLTQAVAENHMTSQGILIAQSIVILGPAVSIGAILWTRTVLTPAQIAMIYGVGLFVRAIIDGPGGMSYNQNPWKFEYSMPLTVIALGLALSTRRRWVELLVVGALAIVSVLNDSRSLFAILLLTGFLIAWQMRSSRSTRRASTARVIIGIGIAAAVVFNVGQALLLDGLFGEATQQRTISQLDQSGSILLGGRPELAATAALFAHQPIGYGSGTLASLNDVLVAKSGMASIGYDPNNGYVENFMFGLGFEVHSITGDLWVRFGLVGLALAALIAWLTIYGLGHGIAHRTGSAIVIYLGVRTCWDLLFSPIYSSVPSLMLFLGLALVLKTTKQAPAPAQDVHEHGRRAQAPSRFGVGS